MEEQSGSVPVARKNKHDIVGSLPLELVVQVIEHLDMADVVRNQRVRTVSRLLKRCHYSKAARCDF